MRELVDSTSAPPELMSRFVEQDGNRKQRLDGIKERIRRDLPTACMITVKAFLGADGRLDQAYLGHFTEQVTSKLKAAIDRHIAAIEQIEQGPNFALKREQAEHQQFRAQKLKVFVGRKSNLDAIKSYIGGSADHPLVLYGSSGAAKSALIARAIADAEAAGDAPVIYRFVGASAASSNFRSLFVSLIEELALFGHVQKPEAFEDDANKFTEQIKSALSSVSKPVVIFLDALDQSASPIAPAGSPRSCPRA